MKSIFLVLVLFAQIAARAQGQPATPYAHGAPQFVPPTDLRIADDLRQIRQLPAKYQAYNDLALALIAKADERRDQSLYGEAESAIKTALQLAPENMQALKTRVVLLLARHEFLQARAEAKALNSKMPDDVSLYGYLATADIELKHYDDAETEAQWMLNLLPGNIPALRIGARLREIYGDPNGALEFLFQAYRETPQSEIQDLASIGVQIARVQINAHKFCAAESVLLEVLKLYPDYPAAVENLALARAEKNKQGEIAEPVDYEKSSVAALVERPVALMSQPAPGFDVSSPSNVSSRIPGSARANFQPVPQHLLLPHPTETDRMIRSLQTRISREPNQYRLYAQLGAAFVQKARETGDVSHFDLAEKALQKSLDMISNDLAAATPTETLAEVYMGEHRFGDALNYAQKSLSFGSGDLSPSAIVGDAYADMGEYEKANEAYGRLEGAQPGDACTRDSRIAFLKFISGDTDASIQLMRRAVGNGAAAQLPSENLAWLYYELGEFYFQNGDPAAADSAYVTALTIHPGDYRALAGLARLRATQESYSDAIELYQRALAVVPMPNFAADLGDIYNKLGRREEAKKQFDLVEYLGTLGAINQVLHNRELALFYADHDIHLQRALDLAQRELEARHDIYTWDVLAWTLFKNKKLEEAKAAIANALRFNTRDALIIFHAGVIYGALGQQATAKDYLQQAININTHFHVLYADAAQRQLAELARVPAREKKGKDDNGAFR